MRRLSRQDLESRRQFDWRVVMQMNKRSGFVFTAHRTPQDAEKGRAPITDIQDARYALHYRAEYRFKTLVEADVYGSCTIVRIDVSDANYPFAEPSAWVVTAGESQIPWSPHFARGLPVCHGTIWQADGQILLGHYLIHLARLLNWDERLEDGYGGYNPRAISWWRKHLNRPLNPELQYPALPVELLYGEVKVHQAGGFKAVNTPVGHEPGGGFRRSR